MKRLITIIASLFTGACSTVQQQTVKNFDVEKYLGKWYEIARYDHSFERGMNGVYAIYSMNEDGTIAVENFGIKPDGERSSIKGEAYIPNKDIPSKLKVTFFWPFYGDYWILDMSPDYSWAIVGSSSRDYLWILSRTKKIDDDTLQKILNIIKKRGYDTSKFIYPKQ